MEITFSNIDNRKQKKKNFINIIPSYLLPHTQIVYKKLLFQLFNPHPHREGTLINLYMNKKKILWLRKGGFPLRIEENNRTSQLAFDSYNFCRAFHGRSSEKKNQNFIICLCRDIYRINYIFSKI